MVRTIPKRSRSEGGDLQRQAPLTAQQPRRNPPRDEAASSDDKSMDSRDSVDSLVSLGSLGGALRPAAVPPQVAAVSPQMNVKSTGLAQRLERAWASKNYLVRYDVADCRSRRVGPYVVQLNLGRFGKRPSQVPHTPGERARVLRPFDPATFNFTKIDPRERLFTFAGRHPVVVNVSPIGARHVLLLHDLKKCQPQALNLDAIRVTLQFSAQMDHPHFVMGYNSLGAFASVNHRHVQGYFLPQPLAIQGAGTVGLFERGDRSIGVLTDYPVRALVVHQASLERAAQQIGAAVTMFQKANQPFNLVVCNRGRSTYVIPQRFAQQVDEGLVDDASLAIGSNPAAFELAGHLPLASQEVFESVTEQAIARLLAAASLDPAHFAILRDAWKARLTTKR